MGDVEMGTEIELLKAALRDPVCGFIYCDWLEEHGRSAEADLLRDHLGFVRKVEMSAAWDRRDPDPSKDYGVHGVELRTILIGPGGAVEFVLFTNWTLRLTTAEFYGSDYQVLPPMPASLTIHSKAPMYTGDEPTESRCKYTGGLCYGDTSGLAAQRVFKALVKGGSEAAWKILEEYYRETALTGSH